MGEDSDQFLKSRPIFLPVTKLISGKFKKANSISNYSVLYKIRSGPSSISGKLIQPPILEF